MQTLIDRRGMPSDDAVSANHDVAVRYVSGRRERTVYGRCQTPPQAHQTRTVTLVTFDLVQFRSGSVLEIVLRLPHDDVGPVIADLAQSPALEIRGQFQGRERDAIDRRAWRLIASTLTLNAAVPKSLRPEPPDPSTAPPALHIAPIRPQRTLTVSAVTLRPMKRHLQGYALAFEGRNHNDTPYDIVYPVADDANQEDLAVLCGQISRAYRLTLTGYFRPSKTLGDHVARWGFVASEIAFIEAPQIEPPPVPTSSRPIASSQPSRRKPGQRSSVTPRTELPLLVLDDAERHLLGTRALIEARFQPSTREILEQMGCRTLAEVADLTMARLTRRRGMTPQRIRLCRSAIKACLPTSPVRERDRKAPALLEP